MTSHVSHQQINRRSTLAALAGASVGLALATTSTVGAQDTALADHPMVGAWLGITPGGPAPVHILDNGAFLSSSGPISVDAEGTVSYASPQSGTWEPAGDRRIHFTSVQSTFDAAGTYTGTVTIDGYPEASEDGETFYDPATEAMLTIRDPSGAVVTVIAPLPPVYGSRLRPGEPVFLTAPPEEATPEG